jgi:hypothetical protein
MSGKDRAPGVKVEAEGEINEKVHETKTRAETKIKETELTS